MQQVENWLDAFAISYKLNKDHENNEYWIDIKGNKRLDRHFFENPILHRCFNVYPIVQHLIENKSYIVVKNGKEIGRDIPWYEIEEHIGKASDRSGIALQRYKGLGEMTPEQLWETTMNPATRTLLGVGIEDAAKADRVFHVLMGGEVPPRKAFIQAHARNVKNLDI